MLPFDTNVDPEGPDSAVPADAMSEEQTFRSEVSLSLIRLWWKWVSASERTSIVGGIQDEI